MVACQKVLVLGGGTIGSAIAMDMGRRGEWRVTVADLSRDRLAAVTAQSGVRIERRDLSQADAVTALAAEHDLVIDALPSAMGFEALRTVIVSGRPAIDVTFMPENALELDSLARERGVAVVVDCGIAPGLSHILAGFAARELAPCERIDIYVGGLPIDRRWPYEYKAGFSTYDVIEEYVRPARVVEGGHVVVKEALSEPERVDIPGIGVLEAALTDGLRSLIVTLNVPFMQEKTLRYPGHVELMRVVRESGFFSKEPVLIEGRPVRPIDVTAAMLSRHWTFAEGEADVTVLRVSALGRREGVSTEYTWEVVDRFDPVTGLRSMSRMTAFPATIVAGLVARGVLGPGVHPPEVIGMQPGLLNVVLGELADRGVRCKWQTRVASR
jgi:lysine 6-dehydrogenase